MVVSLVGSRRVEAEAHIAFLGADELRCCQHAGLQEKVKC